MRGLFILLSAALLLPCTASAYRYDARLSSVLKAELGARLRTTRTGRELLDRLRERKKYGELRVLARSDRSDSLAWFDPSANAVYLNSRYILRFFEAKGFRDPQVVEVLWSNSKVRLFLVKYVSPVYLHELVHALQYYEYPEYRRDAGANPLEFEYEAYLREDMYVDELMRADPGLLRRFIRGEYSDVYTSNVLGSYFTLSLDPGKYKEKIRRYYEEERGYLTLDRAEREKRSGLAGEKVLAYASGAVAEYRKDAGRLARLDREKKEYAAFLDGFYRKRWPSFSARALLFVGTTALQEKNYPLALDCLAVADANSGRYGMAPKTLESLRTKGALAILEAASFIRDNSGKMGIDELSQHLKSLEKACAVTGRPFPEDLEPLRKATWPRAIKYYAARLAAERDPLKKGYYRENLEYFSGAPLPAGGE